MKVTVFYLFLVYSFYFITLSYGQLSSCRNSPCKNGGTCYDQPSTFYGYSCKCTPEFAGVDCQLSKNSGFVVGGGGGGGGGGNFNNVGGDSSNGGNINIGGGGNNFPSGGGNINIGGGGSNFPSGGGNINIGGGGGGFGGGNGNINIGGNNNLQCMNGGTFIKPGLPCACLNGFIGNRCEHSSSNRGACVISPCKNNGLCIPNSKGYKCQCTSAYTGFNCEYLQTYQRRNNALGISLGTILPFLFVLGIIGLCIYCCCLRKKGSNSSDGFFGRARDTFGGQFGGGAFNGGRTNPPPNVGPGYGGPGYGGPAYGGPGYNMQQQRTVYNPQQMPDPDDVFKVQSPPPYESLTHPKN